MFRRRGKKTSQIKGLEDKVWVNVSNTEVGKLETWLRNWKASNPKSKQGDSEKNPIPSGKSVKGHYVVKGSGGQYYSSSSSCWGSIGLTAQVPNDQILQAYLNQRTNVVREVTGKFIRIPIDPCQKCSIHEAADNENPMGLYITSNTYSFGRYGNDRQRILGFDPYIFYAGSKPKHTRGSQVNISGENGNISFPGQVTMEFIPGGMHIIYPTDKEVELIIDHDEGGKARVPGGGFNNAINRIGLLGMIFRRDNYLAENDTFYIHNKKEKRHYGPFKFEYQNVRRTA